MRRTALAFVAGLGLAIVASPAMARQGMGIADDESTTNLDPKSKSTRDVRPPAPQDPGKPSVIMPYLLTFVLGGAAAGLAVLPSRRTHQD